jgi:hypothetical protein
VNEEEQAQAARDYPESEGFSVWRYPRGKPGYGIARGEETLDSAKDDEALIRYAKGEAEAVLERAEAAASFLQEVRNTL